MFSILGRTAAARAASVAAPGAARRSMSTTATPGFKINGVYVSRNAAIAAAAGLSVLLLAGITGGDSKETHAAPKIEVPTAQESATRIELAIEAVSPAVDAGMLSDMEQRIAALETELAPLRAASLNRAFMFLKPHAANSKVAELVEKRLKEFGIKIVASGELKHDQIDEEKLIDTHYGAIASKAVLLTPDQLNVPEKGQKTFEERYGETWNEAVAQGKVYNAMDGAKKLGVDGEGLEKLWRTLDRDTTLIKFGGGFYCGKFDDVYVMNGFYMSMRGQYTVAPAKINYYAVEWTPTTMSWGDFRGKVLGATDPTEAAAGSLRREIYERWEELGLDCLPDTGLNGVHGSASNFEAQAERVNWMKAPLEDDVFAKGMMAQGVDKETLKEWMGDAQVLFQGKKQSVFDLLEDTDAAECLHKASMIISEAAEAK